jgi:hypothetical protein
MADHTIFLTLAANGNYTANAQIAEFIQQIFEGPYTLADGDVVQKTTSAAIGAILTLKSDSELGVQKYTRNDGVDEVQMADVVVTGDWS